MELFLYKTVFKISVGFSLRVGFESATLFLCALNKNIVHCKSYYYLICEGSFAVWKGRAEWRIFSTSAGTAAANRATLSIPPSYSTRALRNDAMKGQIQTQ